MQVQKVFLLNTRREHMRREKAKDFFTRRIVWVYILALMVLLLILLMSMQTSA